MLAIVLRADRGEVDLQKKRKKGHCLSRQNRSQERLLTFVARSVSEKKKKKR